MKPTAPASSDVVNQREAVKLILDTKGRIFAARFVKRTDGSIRRIVCRLGVKKHLKGGLAAYSFKEKGLISVWDCEQRQYRAIPTDTLLDLSINGRFVHVRETNASKK